MKFSGFQVEPQQMNKKRTKIQFFVGVHITHSMYTMLCLHKTKGHVSHMQCIFKCGEAKTRKSHGIIKRMR